MIPERLSIADLDGTLCVVCETTDYAEPRIVRLYWPTQVKTWDFLRLLFNFEEMKNRDDWPTLFAKLTAVRTRPGEYFIGEKAADNFGRLWKSGFHVCLKFGSGTLSEKTELSPAPEPKARKGTCYYWSGGWWVKRTKTTADKIDPLTIATRKPATTSKD